MNKRIQDLVDIAAEAVPGVYSLKYESGDSGVEFDETALQKFVELIVRECAEICRSRKLTPSAFTADDILEHFGVENE